VAQEYVAGVGGQVSNPNRLTGRKALRAVQNCVLDRPGVLKPRRGFDTIADLGASKNIHRMWDYQGALMVHTDDGGGTFKLAVYDGSWTNLASSNYRAPSGRRMSVAEACDDLYLTSEKGVLMLDAFNGTPMIAGAPKAPGFDRANSTVSNDASGILPPQSQVAYRACLYFKDANGRIIRGAPSGRMVLRNTNAGGGSNQTPTVRVLLPKKNGTASTALTTSYFLQVFRSSITSDLSTLPDEDEALIYDAPLLTPQITNGFAGILDVTPDDLRGEFLYTGATRGTIRWANEPPPFANEVVSWKGCLVYLNTTSRQRFELQVLAVNESGSGAGGIEVGDTITFSGSSSFTVTAVASGATPGAGEFKLEATGSASLDLELTAQNLVAAVNEYASNTLLYAYYVGVPSDPRSIGKIIFEARLAIDQSFNVYVGTGSQTGCYEPQLPETNPSTNIVSTCDEWTDGWYISKVREPESVPLLNGGRLGGGETILRGVVCGESLFIFTKTGIWRMTGDPPTGPGDAGTLRVDPWRTTVWCIASETVRALAGSIYALTNQGVVSINDGGVRVVSYDIDPDLRDVFANLATGATPVPFLLESYAFAVAYESDRKYVLALPNAASDTQAQKFLVYDHLEDGWMPWAFADNAYRSCGHVYRDEDKLYFARNDGSQSKVYQERKAFAATDHRDAGDTAIAISVRWWPLVGSNAGRKKFWKELSLLFESGAPSSLSLSIASEFATLTATVGNLVSTIARTWVPQGVRRASRLEVTATWSVNKAPFELSALSVQYRDYGEGRLTK
jgi:hypothetical protein